MYSIRTMLLFVALISVALYLAQFPDYNSMAIILVAIIIPSHFMLSTKNWRLLVYGGMMGVVTLGLIFFSLTYLLYIHLPRPPIRSGYDSGIPVEQEVFAKIINPYIVPFGFLMGAAFCFAWNRRSTSRKNTK